MRYLHRGESRLNDIEIRVKCINTWFIIISKRINGLIFTDPRQYFIFTFVLIKSISSPRG